MSNVTLRELRALLKRSPRLLEQFIYHRAGMVHPDDVQPIAPADEHGYAMDVEDEASKPTVRDAKPWRSVTIPPGPPPKDPHR